MRCTELTNIQLVELKNGVTFNGHLVECDNFMNVTLREVYQTSADGEKFWKMKEMYIKGNIVRRSSLMAVLDGRVASAHRDVQIKYFRIADAILDSAMEEQEKQRALGRNRGGRGGRSRPSSWLKAQGSVADSRQVAEVDRQVAEAVSSLNC